MKKHSIQLVAASLAIGCSAALAAGVISHDSGKTPPRTRAEVMELREAAKAKRTASPKAKAPVTKVKGGLNGDKPLYGALYFSYNYDLEGWFGPTQISADGNHVPLNSGWDYEPFSGVYFDGKYLSIEFGEYISLRVYDAETWQQEGNQINFTKTSNYALPTNLAYDPTTSTIYGCVLNEAEMYTVTDAKFAKIDLSNPLAPITIINDQPMDLRLRGMACNAEGVLYAIGGDDVLYTVDKFSGDLTAVAHVEMPGYPNSPFNYGREGMAIDWETGDIYFNHIDENFDTYIVKIDPKTGAATTVADFSYNYDWLDDWPGSETTDCFSALWFKQSASSSSGTPNAVTDLSATAVGAELKADVTFTMPTTDTDGSALDGDIEWIIAAGNDQLATGTAAAGAVVTEQVTLPAGGKTSIVVSVSKGGLTSASVVADLFIGPDTPEIYGTPRATTTVDGKSINISWNEAYAMNGGNFEAPVTYSLTRMPDNVVVVDDLMVSKYTDNIESDMKTLYTYVITPKAGSVAGQAVTSRGAYAGKYFAVPYEDSFTDADLFLQYPVIDANNDEHYWDINTNTGRECAVYDSNNNDANDYLLIGPFKMTKGSSYTFSFTADGHNMVEYVSAWVGFNDESAADFVQIVPRTACNPGTKSEKLEGVYEATADGDIYFAIKAESPAGSQHLYIYDVSVTVAGPDAPAIPVDLNVIPAAQSATIEFTLPSTTIDGRDLESITGVNIYRDGSILATLTEGVTPGAHLSYVDSEEVAKGFHTYTVAAINNAGVGQHASVQAYRGLDMPGTPRNLRVWEDLDTPGLIHLSFDHPASGYYGGFCDPENITYFVNYLTLSGSSDTVELGKGTEFTFNYNGSTDVQDALACSVYGSNAAGYVRSSWNTKTCIIGPAQALPHFESWPNASQKGGIWTGCSLKDKPELFESYWDIRDGAINGYTPQDNDGGMMALSTSVDGGSQALLSPRYTLEGAENPTMVFYYRYTNDAKEFYINVIREDQPATLFHTLSLDEANAGKWIRVELPLSEFKNDKYVEFAFVGVGNKAEEFICFDNYSVTDYTPYDLSILSFTAPSKAMPNEEVIFSLSIRNNGAREAKEGDYTVRLFKNGTVVDEFQPATLPSMAISHYTLSDIPSVTDPAVSEYYVEVAYAADTKQADNVSALRNVEIVTPEYPCVTDLKAADVNGVELTWSAPDMSVLPHVTTTETFDAYQPFITNNIGNWKMFDGDGAPTVVLAMDVAGPLDYPNIGMPMAWQVIDPVEAGIMNFAWTARSGRNMLVSFQACADATRDVDSNDWLISPELDTEEQTVTFFARAGMSAYAPEIFDFMISSTGDNPEDFTPLATDVELAYSSTDWIEFNYRLPAGTRYFAIVHKSRNKVAMLVDDITFAAAGSPAISLNLQGYNVYRDGLRLNSNPVADTFYNDATVEKGKEYVYNVSAVWDKGESALSPAAVISPMSGYMNLETSSMSVSVLGDEITVNGVSGTVALYDLAGRCIGWTEAQGSALFKVAAPGVYVVKALNGATKVNVRF